MLAGALVVTCKKTWGFVGEMISRGYQPSSRQAAFKNWFICDERSTRPTKEKSLQSILKADPIEFLVIAPTMLHRGNEDEQVFRLKRILTQIDALGADTLVVFGLQAEIPEEGEQRIKAVLARLPRHPRLKLVGLCTPCLGKALTLNSAFNLALPTSYQAAVWIDDDVELEDDCIRIMLQYARTKKYVGSVGPTKIPHHSDYWASRLLFLVKSITMPATNYPHGCCIAVERGIIDKGIPSRYSSDDGFVCFSILSRDLEFATENMTILPDAKCHYVVGAPPGFMRKRIRRLLINHFIFICDYPPRVARYYMRNMLFHGFWPLGKMERSHGMTFASLKWILKAIYFGWFFAVGFELFLRGALNRPLSSYIWGGENQAQVLGKLR